VQSPRWLGIRSQWSLSQVKASLTRALDAGAGAVFTKPCEWRSVVTYLDGLNFAPASEITRASNRRVLD